MQLEKIKTAILIAILLFAAMALVKLFNFNSNLETIEAKLNKSTENLEKVLVSISTAKNEIDSLHTKINRIAEQNNIYQSKRDK